jgi:rRNA-processing protein FCF1
MTNELNDVHKNSLKEEIMNELIEILMAKLHVMVKQNVQDELKQYQEFTNKKIETTQKKLNDFR